ncbi:MAG: VapC toxin family PIN domain ribonuclease [Acidobacteria bacterium]|nr:MAG: VapC toxin family PIN domain ribonuclease [Acidobacteriota bacterium]
MILLDTNIVSEVMKPAPEGSVLQWLDHQETEELYLSTITIAEINFGIRVLPYGKRRHTLADRFENFVAKGFDQRILSFDTKAAHLFAEIMGRRRELGRPMSFPDGQIAAIARSHHFALATRNVNDFKHCGIDILNPFEPKTSF